LSKVKNELYVLMVIQLVVVVVQKRLLSELFA
jgi:hypothetical protein